MATVYGIIKQHGGNIWVYSEPLKGTTFKIYLPVSIEDHAESHEVSESTDRSSGTEGILLVEDNPQVLKLSLSILERQGYTVITAHNGEEALSTIADRKEKIQLLLTDVVMPNMNGKELYTTLVKTNPGLKVLYMSGYTDNVIAHHGVLEEGAQFIQKPFSVQTLTTKVRQILDE